MIYVQISALIVVFALQIIVIIHVYVQGGRGAKRVAARDNSPNIYVLPALPCLRSMLISCLVFADRWIRSI
jgi:hypothetical protein